ncbi:sensor histidine kinase [Paenibacillus silagei]|uniref:Two-component system sensor histidine kinase YesM n=1 Tax=Paenibacillus silagei TaxID=1670801 RepID=A0ABS4P293_9BACL|nr:histidine kinase [Paenibacillus silagei]MBP2116435.1 two-component system sensor histidine kinase YesM [Paenibacillus silagei]
MKNNRKPSAFINDIPLKYKFLFIYLLCVLVPILSINALFYVQISRNVEARERENLEISVDRVAYDLMQIVNECLAISNTVAADRPYMEMMDYAYPDNEAYYDAYNDSLKDKLRQYSTLHSYISWMGIYTSNPTIQNGNSYFILSYADKQSEWYRKISSSTGKVLLTSYQGTDPLNPPQQEVLVSLIRKLDNFTGQPYTKYLRIDLRLNNVQELFQKERDYLDFKLLDEKNRVVLDSNRSFSSLDASALLNVDTSIDQPSKQIVRALSSAAYTKGWRLVGTPEGRKISHEMDRALRNSLILVLLTIILPTLLMIVIIRSYNLRVRLLYKHMKLVKYEQFESIDMYEGKDEIGGLIRSFNLMTGKIRNLINDVYKLEIQKKDLELERVRAELKYLESQVDPHFLFNTLNAILVICKKYKYEQVTDVIRNLALIMRRLLSWKDDLITVEEEVSFIEMYLQIEKFRFQNRFSYVLDIAPEVLNCRIPKMSIQALVENSCKHGLQSVKWAREIHVSASRNETGLLIVVTDNGKGIEKEKLEWIKSHLETEEDTGQNVGLRNVYKRLMLYYNGRAEFSIESTEYERTVITIQIPEDLSLVPMGEGAHV